MKSQKDYDYWKDILTKSLNKVFKGKEPSFKLGYETVKNEKVLRYIEVNLSAHDQILVYDFSDDSMMINKHYFQIFNKDSVVCKSDMFCKGTYDLLFNELGIIYAFQNIAKVLKENNLRQFTLKELRTKEHLTQKELASELGTNLRTIHNWETSGINLGSNRKLISLYFNIPEKLIDFEANCNEA